MILFLRYYTISSLSFSPNLVTSYMPLTLKLPLHFAMHTKLDFIKRNPLCIVLGKIVKKTTLRYRALWGFGKPDDLWSDPLIHPFP